jgi:hypothetical protein
MTDPWQVLSDCPHCLCEAAVVEEMDPVHPACHLGVPARRRCRLCAWEQVAVEEPFAPRHPTSLGRCPACHKPLSEAARAGEGPCSHCGYAPTLREVRAPEDLRDEGEAVAALARWAAEEGEPDVGAFCVANMGVAATVVVAALARRERVGTTFDVIAFLFPGGGAPGATADPRSPAIAKPVTAPAPASIEAPAATMDPRTPARVLVSVMVADGTLRSGERTFVVRWLAREGLPPLGPDDLRVWRPSELGAPPPPEVRDRLLEAAVQLMHLDRERDGSEWRVIRTFARAWGVPDAALEAWDRRFDRRYASPMARLARALDRLFT